MQTFFLRHKVTTGDTPHLSDTDSQYILQEGKLKVEDIVEIQTHEKRYLAQIVDTSKNSVEVEILEELGHLTKPYIPTITILQALSNDTKFTYFIEKSVEIGVEKIIPVESEYSLKKKKQAIKDIPFWNRIVKDATEQSRNLFPTIIESPKLLTEITNKDIHDNAIKICLSTENVDAKDLKTTLKQLDISQPTYMAIGPEKGWSTKDIEHLKSLGFLFVKLQGNILRTETTGLVITSILKYLKGEI